MNFTEKSVMENKVGYMYVYIHTNIRCVVDLPQKVIEKTLAAPLKAMISLNFVHILF